ncbi:A1S_2505 family phage non-structural protein [Leptolyngbya sp. AN03gr2]|uniref:A1S_2505 family phage non-structural protein n=1 Tax=unclassified Leptolyngbya TaxID=2650499 RepID=UPI003D310480
MAQLKQIQMVFPLKNFGDLPQTPSNVTTCIEAMRGYGRCHTTRNFQPSERWGIRRGDIAIAIGESGKAVAFRVGREYQITPDLAADTNYQEEWAKTEKHSAKYLKQLSQTNPDNLWGLKMQPLGDWIDGEIKPFPTQPDQTHWARVVPGNSGYEVSSQGDKRFSALYARLSDGRTIEEAYQLDVKGYRIQGDDWRLGKGKAPLAPLTPEQAYLEYRTLWQQWTIENPQAFQELVEISKGKILTDRYASSPISQARALADLVNEAKTPTQAKHYELVSKQGTIRSEQHSHPRRSIPLTTTAPFAPASPDQITQLEPHQIFVFGANTEYRHGAFGAKQALKFGAKYRGMQPYAGQTYAIVTKNLSNAENRSLRSVPLEAIDRQIHQLCRFAKTLPNKEFLVTKIGCGAGGYTEAEIGALWLNKEIPTNIRLPQAFIDVIQSATEQQAVSQEITKPTNPLIKLKPLNAQAARHMKKDIEMGELATQFIGYAASSKASSTENYRQAWAEIGLANTGKYTSADIVMVSGNGPWRAAEAEIQKTFEQKYKPLLAQAIAAKASFVVGDAAGTDRLVQHYLQSQGCQISANPKGFMQAKSPNRDVSLTAPETLTNQGLDIQLRKLEFNRFKPNEGTIQYDLSTHNAGDGLESFRFDKASRTWTHFSRLDDDGAPIVYHSIPQTAVKTRLDQLESWKAACTQSETLSLKDWVQAAESTNLTDQSSLLDRLQDLISPTARTARLFLEPETANALGINLDTTGTVKGLESVTFSNQGWEICKASYTCPLTQRQYLEETALLEINFTQTQQFNPSKPPILLACDGACSMKHQKQQYPGGWGTFIQYPNGKEVELSGYALKTTNNRMETTALIEGLRELYSNSEEALRFSDHPIKVIADSQYVINVATEKKKAHENKDLWAEYKALSRDRIQEFEWVEGHSGHRLNERADALATQQRDIAKTILDTQTTTETATQPTHLQPQPQPSTTLTELPQKYPVYLSLVQNEVNVHEQWLDCKAHIHGQSKAESKLCKTANEVEQTLKKWNKELPQFDASLSGSPDQLSQKLLEAIRISYEKIEPSDEPVKLPIGNKPQQWIALVHPNGYCSVRNEAKRTTLIGNCFTTEVEVPLSKKSAAQFEQMPRELRSTQIESPNKPTPQGFDFD